MTRTYTYATTSIVLRDTMEGREIWVGHASPPGSRPPPPPEVAHHLPQGAVAFTNWGDFTAWLIENRVQVENCWQVVEERLEGMRRGSQFGAEKVASYYSDDERRRPLEFTDVDEAILSRAEPAPLAGPNDEERVKHLRYRAEQVADAVNDLRFIGIEVNLELVGADQRIRVTASRQY